MISLSEIDTTVKRASKAVGFSWGIAEEVGKSIRLLEMFGLPGIKNLNLYLQKIKKTRYCGFLCLVCGERGIRTPGPVTDSSFQD